MAPVLLSEICSMQLATSLRNGGIVISLATAEPDHGLLIPYRQDHLIGIRIAQRLKPLFVTIGVRSIGVDLGRHKSVCVMPAIYVEACDCRNVIQCCWADVKAHFVILRHHCAECANGGVW